MIQIERGLSKEQVVERVRAELDAHGFEIAEQDVTRPWGAFLRVANKDADKFIATYFDKTEIPKNARQGERSPKFLIVAPQQRLSWQYHSRRAEWWRATNADVGVFVSDTDEQPAQYMTLRVGETIELAQGVRHRLVGLDEWGVVAEIWIHSDPQNISDENDIVRLQDDYARN